MEHKTQDQIDSGIFELNQIGLAIKNSGAQELNVQMILSGIDARINALAAEKAQINTPTEITPARK